MTSSASFCCRFVRQLESMWRTSQRFLGQLQTDGPKSYLQPTQSKRAPLLWNLNGERIQTQMYSVSTAKWLLHQSFQNAIACAGKRKTVDEGSPIHALKPRCDPEMQYLHSCHVPSTQLLVSSKEAASSFCRIFLSLTAR